nr:hypothetical protein [Bacillus sp. MRMR6]
MLTDKGLKDKVHLTVLGLPSEMAEYIESGVGDWMYLQAFLWVFIYVAVPNPITTKPIPKQTDLLYHFQLLSNCAIKTIFFKELENIEIDWEYVKKGTKRIY